VIPVYNEAKNITLLTEELVSILPKLKKHGRSFLLMTVQPMKAFRPLRRFQTNGPAFVFLVLKKQRADSGICCRIQPGKGRSYHYHGWRYAE